jgi:hypothetical protein
MPFSGFGGGGSSKGIPFATASSRACSNLSMRGNACSNLPMRGKSRLNTAFLKGFLTALFNTFFNPFLKCFLSGYSDGALYFALQRQRALTCL